MDENEKKAGNCENTLDSRQWIHLHSFTPALSLAKFILRDLMLAEENSCKINFINKFYPIWTMKVDNWESFWVEEKQKQSNTAKLNIESSKCKKINFCEMWNKSEPTEAGILEIVENCKSCCRWQYGSFLLPRNHIYTILKNNYIKKFSTQQQRKVVSAR